MDRSALDCRHFRVWHQKKNMRARPKTGSPLRRSTKRFLIRQFQFWRLVVMSTPVVCNTLVFRRAVLVPACSSISRPLLPDTAAEISVRSVGSQGLTASQLQSCRFLVNPGDSTTYPLPNPVATFVRKLKIPAGLRGPILHCDVVLITASSSPLWSSEKRLTQAVLKRRRSDRLQHFPNSVALSSRSGRRGCEDFSRAATPECCCRSARVPAHVRFQFLNVSSFPPALLVLSTLPLRLSVIDTRQYMLPFH